MRGFPRRRAELTPEQRLVMALSGMVLVLIGGVAGYAVIEGWSLAESLYMTVITVSTVGYFEVQPLSKIGRYFTMALIVLGVGLVFYSFGVVLEIMIEGGIRDILGRRRVEREIRKLKDHYIVCGHGRIGSVVVEELLKRKMPLIVIEAEASKVRELLDRGIVAIHGNAGDEETLKRAGIERACGLVGVAATDADNLFITITARGLNKDLFITTRAETKETVRKMHQVGANKVVSPYLIGAYRLVNTMLKPTVTRFIELSSLEQEMDVRIEEVEIAEGSKLKGQLLKNTPIRSELGIIVIGIEKQDRTMVFNPPPDQVIEGGDVLITIGTPAQTEKLLEMVSP
jgi:voltage-gated potassium channel